MIQRCCPWTCVSVELTLPVGSQGELMKRLVQLCVSCRTSTCRSYSRLEAWGKIQVYTEAASATDATGCTCGHKLAASRETAPRACTSASEVKTCNQAPDLSAPWLPEVCKPPYRACKGERHQKSQYMTQAHQSVVKVEEHSPKAVASSTGPLAASIHTNLPSGSPARCCTVLMLVD